MKKVINLMRAIVGKDWGADKQSLIYIYIQGFNEVSNRLRMYGVWSSS